MPRSSGRLSQVIPSDWSGSNRHQATLFLTSRCTISRPGVGMGGFDPATGTGTAPAPSVVASNVRCRVEVVPRTAGLAKVAAEERIEGRRYTVQVPWDVVDVTVHDVVTVTAAEDPGLVGIELRVTALHTTSLQWSRVLQAEVFDR